jgi:hypothetical protein
VIVSSESGNDQPVRSLDLAALTLRAAKEDARRRGAAVGKARAARSRKGRTRRWNSAPVPVGQAVSELVEKKAGWLSVSPLVAALWEEAAPDIARHIAITHFNKATGSLHTRADSTAWATQMRLIASPLASRLNEILRPAGIGPIRHLSVSGPTSEHVVPLPIPGPERPQGESQEPTVFPRAFANPAGLERMAGDPVIAAALARQAQRALHESASRPSTGAADVQARSIGPPDLRDSAYGRALLRARSDKNGPQAPHDGT